MIKKLRKLQKIILLIALIFIFYFLIHPEFFYYSMRRDTLYHYSQGRQWLWEDHGGLPYSHSKMILNVLITCTGTGIALFIESLIYSNKEED